MLNSRTRLMLACISTCLLSALFNSACNAPDENSGSASNTSSPFTAGPNGNAKVGMTPATGGSCVSNDPEQFCLGVHFVSYKDSSGKPVASEGQVATIFNTMNSVWSACKIGFQVDHYEAVDPRNESLSYGAQSQNETNAIRRIYTNSNDELLAVNTGPWGTAVNAWTNMPGESVHGAIMESSIVGYGGGIIYAHEFGHYLGLDHASNSSNLMTPVIHSSSRALSSSQCAEARSIIGSYWSSMLRR